MPHKRAKASIRKELSFKKGNDLPPNKLATKPPKKKSKIRTSSSSSNEIQEIPKNMYRILNSERIREEYKKRIKEKNQTDLNRSTSNPIKSKSKKSNELRIEHGEKLSEFNQRVEQSMRSKVSKVMKIAKNKSIIKKPISNPSKLNLKSEESIQSQSKEEEEKKKPKEFEPKPTKFSLNDIVMEPPIDLKKPSKGNQTLIKNQFKKLPISNHQKKLIEDEREKVIKTYRKLKEDRLNNLNSSSSKT
ncbi:hypothetical protein DFH28DRAFT_1057416 [Melampsora americana]|nr:hypothetical protein DFH28DRAFT_1057416 [Melampsora americana]